MKKCLVTLTIGDDFKRFWKKYFEHRLDEYATRHGYDIVAIDDYIDTRFNILWDDSFFESYPFLQMANFRDDRRLSALRVTTPIFSISWAATPGTSSTWS